jgi:hypothetical protein
MSGIEHYDGEAVEKGSSPKIYLVKPTAAAYGNPGVVVTS